LTTRHYILSAELTKMHSFRLVFGDFAQWEGYKISHLFEYYFYCYYIISSRNVRQPPSFKHGNEWTVYDHFRIL